MSTNILVIDDDPSIRAVLTDALSDEGYAILSASDGVEALLVLEQSIPTLILLDMRMPVLDGWRFAQHLRERGLHIPIIVMTGAQDAKQRAQEVGAVGCVPKPFDLDELLDAVGNMV